MGIFEFQKSSGMGGTVGNDKLTDTRQIKTLLEKYDLQISNPLIEIHDGTVTIRGEAENHEIKEKAVLVAGNIPGVERVDDQLSVKKKSDEDEETEFYTVEKGDTLSGISKKYYGDPSLYPRIFEANQPMLEDPEKIYPGQVLRIPQPRRQGYA